MSEPPGAAAPAAHPGFEPRLSHPRVLLLGEGAGIPVVVECALELRARDDAPWRPLVLLGAEGPFGFRPRPSAILVPGAPAGVIACLPRLDAASIPSRLASASELPGCFPGSVLELAELWLATLERPEHALTGLWACGPGSLAPAAVALAARCGLPYLAPPAGPGALSRS